MLYRAALLWLHFDCVHAVYSPTQVWDFEALSCSLLPRLPSLVHKRLTHSKHIANHLNDCSCLILNAYLWSMISRGKLEKVMLINRQGEVLPAPPTMPYAPTTLSPSGRQPIHWLRAQAKRWWNANTSIYLYRLQQYHWNNRTIQNLKDRKEEIRAIKTF